MKKRIIALIVTVMAFMSLSLVAVPAASASPLCELGAICGRVRVDDRSNKDCTITIDGNWADGSAGSHKILWNAYGYRDSLRFYKDTDGYRIRSGCYGRTVPGGKYYSGGVWRKISDTVSIKFRLYKK